MTSPSLAAGLASSLYPGEIPPEAPASPHSDAFNISLENIVPLSLSPEGSDDFVFKPKAAVATVPHTPSPYQVAMEEASLTPLMGTFTSPLIFLANGAVASGQVPKQRKTAGR